tara:strand:- start:45627 stop:46280 length:654 start_codon:yes stop_codon:yes gene_type:complete
MGCATQAQQIVTNQEKISINMTASESIEADVIIFNININAEGDTPRNAFSLHKERESVLADLFKKFDINEEDINFQPIRINKRYTNNGKSQLSATSQQVSVTFTDFEIYEDIQLTLIENNFDSFSGNFSSTKMENGKEKALLSAIEAAKQKAQLIAKASGVTLGDVINISYSDYVVSRPKSYARTEMMTMDASSSMMDFAQTVSVTANISIEFAISN